ncbi:hypothetical protein C8R43DRAFT_1126052 [Mycena crocata]|nr:hypothetical protein C8R43DRAFT_1126052 [Mycena crocata]
MNPAAREPLPGFSYDALFHELHAALWPDETASTEEPPASKLLEVIETLTPDDGWLSSLDGMDLDYGGGDETNGGGDVHTATNNIRYINPNTHPALDILNLASETHVRGDKATFVVRDEYDLFLQHARSCVAARAVDDDAFRARFFVTGQPGIGKSSSAFSDFRAHNIPVFFVNSRTEVFYFSSDGVQRTDAVLKPVHAITDALHKSWVLIDVDDSAEWRCPQIFQHGLCVIWTSPPCEPHMSRFMEKFGAERWYMKAWSPKEIAAGTIRNRARQNAEKAGDGWTSRTSPLLRGIYYSVGPDHREILLVVGGDLTHHALLAVATV